jgi:two-component sensor histidine kinase
MIFLTLFVLACLAWLVFGELSGLFKPETLEKSVIGDFITVAVIIGVTAFLGSFVSADLFRGNRRLKEELEQRRRAEERLAADMAGRLEIEGKLREALDEKTALLGEKELLLKEVHHRVKNNMQVVASILSLQADLLEDPATVAILRESQNRVFSLSLVHEQLYKTSNLASINFREYLENLASTLADSYDSKAKHVQFAYRIGELALGVEQAIPCGLIVNELVSNALKHAFPDRGKGTVVIGLLELRDGRYELSVEDDGVGIALDKDWRVTTSLGMQLVQSLTKQLRGEVNLERLSPGSRFTIHFSPS